MQLKTLDHKILSGSTLKRLLRNSTSKSPEKRSDHCTVLTNIASWDLKQHVSEGDDSP